MSSCSPAFRRQQPGPSERRIREATQFKGRIAHGILTASFISTVLGTRVPGPGCIYLSQNLKFKAPVRIGDTVQARVTVTEVVAEKRRVLFKTVVSVGDTVVIDGDAMLMVPSRGPELSAHSGALPLAGVIPAVRAPYIHPCFFELIEVRAARGCPV